MAVRIVSHYCSEMDTRRVFPRPSCNATQVLRSVQGGCNVSHVFFYGAFVSPPVLSEPRSGRDESAPYPLQCGSEPRPALCPQGCYRSSPQIVAAVSHSLALYTPSNSHLSQDLPVPPFPPPHRPVFGLNVRNRSQARHHSVSQPFTQCPLLLPSPRCLSCVFPPSLSLYLPLFALNRWINERSS